jgi:hypothetical protein
MSSLQSATLHTSRPVEVVLPAGAARSLGDVLHDLLPALCAGAWHPGLADGEQAAGSSGGESEPLPPQQVRQALLDTLLGSICRMSVATEWIEQKLFTPSCC